MVIGSCIGNIQQYAKLVDKKSSYQPIYIGVPQRSIFGPVLFNMYVSLLPLCLKSSSIQYADGASLYLSNFIRNIQSTISVLETDIKNLNKWSENSCLVFSDYKLLMYYLHLKEQRMTEVTQ